MKLIYVLSFLVCLSSLVLGQKAEIPTILVPSDYAKSEAARLDAQAFKLLPRDVVTETSSDKDSPLGVRGSGAYYSFTTRSHSYDKIPQISLDHGLLSVGFYGASYGLMADLGKVSLSGVDRELAEVKYLLSYKSPLYEKEVRAEKRDLVDSRQDKLFRRDFPAVAGHTYLLRAISFDEADILVAFTVASISDDGSVNIYWRKIADFEKPIMLSMKDDEMQAIVNEILVEEKIKNISIVVRNNVLVISGQITADDYFRLNEALKSKHSVNKYFRHRGSENSQLKISR